MPILCQYSYLKILLERNFMRKLSLTGLSVLGLISWASLTAQPYNAPNTQAPSENQGSPYDQDAEDYEEEDEDVIILEDDEEESQTST